MPTMNTSEFFFILKPSPIAGLGVFAACNISAGTVVFKKFPRYKRRTHDIPSEFRNYCIFINDEECLAPKRFDRMEIGWYINHNAKPNIGKKLKTDDFAITLCNIKQGEEIFIDYNQFDEPEHLKEEYFRC